MDGNDSRRIRDEYGWTQADLAEKLGVSKRTVEQWEQTVHGKPVRGIGEVNAEKLRKLEGGQRE